MTEQPGSSRHPVVSQCLAEDQHCAGISASILPVVVMVRHSVGLLFLQEGKIEKQYTYIKL